MLCSTCANAFREQDDSDNRNTSGDRQDNLYLVPSRSRESEGRGRSPSPVPCSPFYKASHHNLPRLKQSAVEGCPLCILLWAAAPPRVHAFWDEHLRDDRPAHWPPGFITIDRAIFSPSSSATRRKLLLEYKYHVGITDPQHYVKPLKRHFRVLLNEAADTAPGVQQPAKITATTTQSQESWATFKNWVWTCISQHSQCSPKSLGIGHQRRQLPRRLLEISPESNIVRLRTVESIGDVDAIEYLALSHCWGPSPPQIILNSSSTNMLFGGVDITALCQTFQDAIAVTRRFWDEFAVRYLWIDSLCIVQDSADDWRQESAVMGEIYQNAFCTLAATAAADGTHGLFSDRDVRVVSPCAISVHPLEGPSKSFYCVDHQDWTRNVARGPLNRRSWVLQERLLSPRVLHFAADQLYWECSGLEASEAFPLGFPDTGFGEQFKQLLPFSGQPPRLMQNPAAVTGQVDRRGAYAIWDQVMETYSAGSLSRGTDRLVALSGIARKLQRRLIQQDTYLAGLWKQDLPFGLLWDVVDHHPPPGQARPPSPRPSPIYARHQPHTYPHSNHHSTKINHEYIAPSWSWASRVSTTPCDDPETWAAATTQPLIEITSATVLPLLSQDGLGGDHMGQLRGGSLGLVGVLARASLSRTHQPGSSTPGLALRIRDRNISSAILRPDGRPGSDDNPSSSDKDGDRGRGRGSTVTIPHEVYCLPILRGMRNRAPRYRGLLLVPCAGRECAREFRRWGTFTADSFGDEFLVSWAPPWNADGETDAARLMREDGRVEITIV